VGPDPALGFAEPVGRYGDNAGLAECLCRGPLTGDRGQVLLRELAVYLSSKLRKFSPDLLLTTGSGLDRKLV
jgi:hypothetical protein